MGHIHVCDVSAAPCDDPEDQMVVAHSSLVRHCPYVPSEFGQLWHLLAIDLPVILYLLSCMGANPGLLC